MAFSGTQKLGDVHAGVSPPRDSKIRTVSAQDPLMTIQMWVWVESWSHILNMSIWWCLWLAVPQLIILQTSPKTGPPCPFLRVLILSLQVPTYLPAEPAGCSSTDVCALDPLCHGSVMPTELWAVSNPAPVAVQEHLASCTRHVLCAWNESAWEDN